MYGIVYEIKNKLNGKRYVGQTTSPVNRQRDHFSPKGSRSPILRKAMRKYGKENFSFEVIDYASCKDELDRKEIFWIEQLNAKVPLGYNIREGGSHGKLAERSKFLISKANKGKLVGEKNPRYGFSGPLNPMYGKVGPNKGKRLSEEQRQLLSTRIQGKKRSNETKARLSASSFSRWEQEREQHFLKKGHEYVISVIQTTGAIRCAVCKKLQQKKYTDAQKKG